jgi:hypothetical protein
VLQQQVVLKMATVGCNIDEALRDQVIKAELRYHANRDLESRTEYLKALIVFKNFVFYGELPND